MEDEQTQTFDCSKKWTKQNSFRRCGQIKIDTEINKLARYKSLKIKNLLKKKTLL
mgnify:CR=1 FL=1